ncbi:efflux RND transporter periplasmic adaptor subunit [Vogesella sp. LIG4]|uniref:efflux RND transporter periplasmic adaptor subunit n=1 Tax=Vogesella sp. LIG4 TaxID=1192162 RepID=UPI00081FD091|nr:efflux RND transporter periplasmic adaptor subunit [Vogesella sp. LIG4]SCK21635.1 RND family efflux transporter, MFP subunit [Vogesella sp. LIG4]
MNRKQTITLTVAASLLLAGGGWLLWPARPAVAAAQAESHPALTVSVLQPRQERWPQSISLNGALAAWQEASISAETGGLRIVALHADVGSQVKRGQLLAELFSAGVRADVSTAEAALAEARTTLTGARSDLARASAVKDSGALSAQKIEQYALAVQTAEAGVKSAAAKLDSARITLTQTQIRAVDDGVITKRSATLGTVVSSGSELFTLQRQGRLEWRAEVSAQQLPSLHAGQQALLTLSDGSQVQGRLRQLAPALDASTRTALAYVDLPSGSAARAGMYAGGRILLGESTALTVPASAVVVRDGHSYVFVANARSQVSQREVMVGRRQGQRVELSRGVKADERLVASGGGFLNDGDNVRIVAGKEGA